MSKSQVKDLRGQRFHRLTVREDSGQRDKQGGVLWLCDCKCGGTKLTNGVHLRRGQVKSCGCAAAEQRSVSFVAFRTLQEDVKDISAALAEAKGELAKATSYIAYLESQKALAGKEGPRRRTREDVNESIPNEFMAVFD